MSRRSPSAVISVFFLNFFLFETQLSLVGFTQLQKSSVFNKHCIQPSLVNYQLKHCVSQAAAAIQFWGGNCMWIKRIKNLGSILKS